MSFQNKSCPEHMYEDAWVEDNQKIIDIRKKLETTKCCERHPFHFEWKCDMNYFSCARA